MEFVTSSLEQQPLMALFLTIAIGYLVGEINIKGCSLGVGAVLFVALVIGWFAPASAPPPMVGTLGLALFLYAVGIQYGRQFFVGLTSRWGIRANALALTGVLLAGVASLALADAFGLSLEYGLGLFAGSGTSTPSLQAAIATLGNDDPAVGYSVAYPFGVAGPILLLSVLFAVLKPAVPVSAGSALELLEIRVTDPRYLGRRLGDLMAALPADVHVVALRRADRNQPASPSMVISESDILLAVGSSRAALEQARVAIGERVEGQLTSDRRDLDYLRVFASRPSVVGRMLGDIELPGGSQAGLVAHVRRGDTELQVRPDLVLEFGDRVGVLAHRAEFSAVRKFFGDSIKSTAEFSYISIGLAMALGFLVGAINIPLPGNTTIALGLSGVLIVALILGKFRRAAGLNWTIPLSANLVLRSLGLTLFLAQVGMASGPKFVATVADTGPLLLGLGAIVLGMLVAPIFIVGLFVFRMPYGEVAGIISGACGNPAILAYANRQIPTDVPDACFATIFPGMTIAKILFVDLAPALLR
jgi:putative transport protein